MVDLRKLEISLGLGNLLLAKEIENIN